MPAGDGTGPLGYGSRTGRGFGNCAPAQYTNAENNERPNERPIYGLGRGGLPRGGGRGLGFGGGRGQGFGAGRGFGRGMGLRSENYSQPLTKEQELELLTKQKEGLEKRIEELSEK